MSLPGAVAPNLEPRNRTRDSVSSGKEGMRPLDNGSLSAGYHLLEQTCQNGAPLLRPQGLPGASLRKEQQFRFDTHIQTRTQ